MVIKHLPIWIFSSTFEFLLFAAVKILMKEYELSRLYVTIAQ